MAPSLFLFYIFSIALLGAAVFVVTARNMVHSVLFLILAFLNAAGLFILMGAEFLGMIFAIVYVGAVAVLFLFVVMMLSRGITSSEEVTKSYKRIGLGVGVILLTELSIVAKEWRTSPDAFELRFAPPGNLTNTEALGNLLYTHYIFVFQMAGLILLIAMIGAIVLTLRFREDSVKQKVRDQLARTPTDSIRLVDISRDS